MIEREITLSEILAAREERVSIQNALLGEYRAPVVAFTMNIAGPVKRTALSYRSFLWGMEQLRQSFFQNKIQVLKAFSRALPTGDEGYFAVDAPAERVKALCVELEEASPVGRLFDMDVIGLDGKKLERDTERPCIVCGKPGRGCASRRVHTAAEVREASELVMREAIARKDRARIGQKATLALLEEVSVTPKPGLVDRANNGAHRDMDFLSFQASAAALRDYWTACFERGALGVHGDSGAEPPSETFAALRPLGKQAEREMLAATGGVNTHKGAIFTLGVLCGAVGRLWTAEEGFPPVDIILDEAAAMTRETLEKELPAARWNTAGEGLYRKYGVRGIRGQVADGLPAVRNISLPVFRELLSRGLDRNHAASVTLLHLIAKVEDTNLLHRGGPEGAAWAKEAVGALIERPSEATGNRQQTTGAELPSGQRDSVASYRSCAPVSGTLNGDGGTDCRGQCAHWPRNDSSGSRIPSPEQIAALDRQFIERNLSPGGCADLLAVTLFLESLSS